MNGEMDEYMVHLSDGRCHWNMLFWAEDEEHATEQALDSQRGSDECSVEDVWIL